ncbi:MAG: pyruvate kinase [Alphaproteobacteria bacterium]
MIALTKIIATLGPGSSSPEMIAKLVKAGVNIFRLNFSHGTHAEHLEQIKIIRLQSKKDKQHYTILADMQGPKLRVGHFKEGEVVLRAGEEFVLDNNEKAGDVKRVYLPHPEIFKVIKVGMNLLLNDGKIVLNVIKADKNKIQTKIIVGGTLSDHKGVNVPDVVLPISALTPKDKKDLSFALKAGVDWVCLSFVQTAEDIRQARKIIEGKAGILAKIEKPSAVENINEIVKEADAIMVARGDLGVECPVESVPALQRKIITVCRLAGKPVVVATQMLESMIEAPVPTRAEVSDVANAVYMGADAVMLSAETAVGKYPVKAVETMKRVILQTQSDSDYQNQLAALKLPLDCTIACAVTSSMRRMIHSLDKPACIATCSMSGRTTLRVARERALVPILGMTTDEKVANRLGLVWGVVPVLCDKLKEMSQIAPMAIKIAKTKGLAHKNEQIIITAGIPFGYKGNTNLLYIVNAE